MKLYVPYASFPLVEAVLSEIGNELDIDVDYKIPTRRVNIRNAAPLRAGKPHVEIDGLKLRAKKGNDYLRKFSNERRTVGICWHGHKMFMERIFLAFNDATLRTCLAKYKGVAEFDALHYATQYQPFNHREHCECNYFTTNDEGLTVYF